MANPDSVDLRYLFLSCIFLRRITTTERGAFHHTHIFFTFCLIRSWGFGWCGWEGRSQIPHRAREIAKAFFFSEYSERASELVNEQISCYYSSFNVFFIVLLLLSRPACLQETRRLLLGSPHPVFMDHEE
jgi:hypothetical protein